VTWRTGTGLPRARCLLERPRRKPNKNHQKTSGLNMADKSSLGLLGFLFGGVTFAVTIIAFLVVRDHVEGRLQMDEVAMTPQLVSTSIR
jgi:hypothetical protein